MCCLPAINSERVAAIGCGGRGGRVQLRAFAYALGRRAGGFVVPASLNAGCNRGCAPQCDTAGESRHGRSIFQFHGVFPAGSAGQPVGQSVTTASGGPWGSLSFNFIDDSSNPYASGNLYVLSQVYAGSPAALSAATPGFIGVAAASGGVWTFAPSLILHSSTQYFFYMDSNITSSIALEVPGNYAGGTAYSAASTTRNYGPTSGDLDFLLTGTQSNPGPIPGSGALSYLVLGFGGAAAFRKRLRARVKTLLATLKLGISGCPAAA